VPGRNIVVHLWARDGVAVPPHFFFVLEPGNMSEIGSQLLKNLFETEQAISWRDFDVAS